MVIVVMDRSGSMGNWTWALQVALAHLLGEFESFHCVTFDTSAECHMNLTPSTFTHLNLSARGRTYMCTAIPHVRGILQKAKPNQNIVMIVASDGDLNDMSCLGKALRDMKANLNLRSRSVSVIGCRIGNHGDTRAISMWCECLAENSSLCTIYERSQLRSGLQKCAEEVCMARVGKTSVLRCPMSKMAVVSKSCFAELENTYTREIFVRPGETVFLRSEGRTHDSVEIDGVGVPIIKVHVDGNVLEAALRKGLVRVKNTLVSNQMSAENSRHRLHALEKMASTPTRFSETFRAIAPTKFIVVGQKQEKRIMARLRSDISRVLNEAGVVYLMNQEECAQFIQRSSQAKSWAKRISIMGNDDVEKLLRDVVAWWISTGKRHHDEQHHEKHVGPLCFLTQASTGEWFEDLIEAVSSAPSDDSFYETLSDPKSMLSAVGVVGLAVKAKEGQGVQADAWNLRFSGIEKIYMTTTINAAALAQAHESDFEVKDPYERDVITACIPIAWHEGDEAMFSQPAFRKILDMHSAMFFHSITTPIPNQTAAMVACGILAFIGQLDHPWTECSDREREMMLKLCRTFLALTKEHVSFREHCRDAPLLSGSRYHKDQIPFSVTRLRVLAHVVASHVTEEEFTDREDIESVTAKLYSLVLYRLSKRVMSSGDDNQTSRDHLLKSLLVGDLEYLLDEGGPLSYVKTPFVRGPIVVAHSMLNPPADPEFESNFPETWRQGQKMERSCIDTVRTFLGCSPLPPEKDFGVVVAALSSKCEDDRPLDSESFVVLKRLNIAQNWFDRELKHQKIREEYEKHMNLLEQLVLAPSLETFYELMCPEKADESKASADDRVANGLRKRDKIVLSDKRECVGVFNELVVRLEEAMSDARDEEDALLFELCRQKLILIITGRCLKDFGEDEPDKVCFHGSACVEMYEEHLKPIVSALDYSCAETFRGIYAYRGDSENATKNRHGHGNKFPSYFALDGGIPPGDDYAEHPEKYSAQQLWEWKERVTKRVFLDYVYEHHMRGCCGLNRIDGKGHIANKAVEPQMSEYINKVKSGIMTKEGMLLLLCGEDSAEDSGGENSDS